MPPVRLPAQLYRQFDADPARAVQQIADDAEAFGKEELAA